MWQRFQVERYLEHHGEKLAQRFDANSYLLLTKAMDLHDLSRGRGGLDAAVARITAPTLALGVSSDMLYPTYQQKELVRRLIDQGLDAHYREIVSKHGHDAFLIEFDQVGTRIHDFLGTLEN